MASKKIVTASTVRTWATEQGLTVGKRGRLSPEVRKAFAEANKGQSYEVGHKEIVTEFVTARAEGVLNVVEQLHLDLLLGHDVEERRDGSVAGGFGCDDALAHSKVDLQ